MRITRSHAPVARSFSKSEKLVATVGVIPSAVEGFAEGIGGDLEIVVIEDLGIGPAGRQHVRDASEAEGHGTSRPSG